MQVLWYENGDDLPSCDWPAQCCCKCFGEQAKRRNAAQAGLNETPATIMDMSATELLKALDHAGAMPALGEGISVHPGLRTPSHTQSGCRNWASVGRFLPVCGSPLAPISTALLIALSLLLTGCGVLQPGTTANPTPPARANTEGTHELASATKQPETPARLAQPVSQPARRVSETKPPPVTTSKGAEKLLAPNAPAPVRASERTTLPAQPSAPLRVNQKTTVPTEPSAPDAPVAEDSGSVTGATVQALILKGPPPQARPPRAGMKVLVWFGLGLGAAALAVLARVYVMRRAKPAGLADPRKDELKMPSELLLKDPLNLPPETVLAEKN
jgi:hypothetical protein